MSYISEIRKKVGHDPVFMPASACAIIKDSKILLQKREDTGTWALHGGSLEFHETFLDALKRETFEELGIEILNPIMIGVYAGDNMHFIYPNKDEVYAVTVIYLVSEYKNDFNLDYNEVLEVKWFDIDNLPNNINSPDVDGINDAIDYYKKNLRGD